MNKYNAEAVAKEIGRDRRISGREARLIHSLLRGRQPVADSQHQKKSRTTA